MALNKFIGFSTVNKRRPPFRLTDSELVKQDLRNLLMTKRGERVMRPNYGSKLHEYLFEPFDDITRQAIRDDVLELIDREPRVANVEIFVRETDNGFGISLEMDIVPDYTPERLYVRFERNNEEIE